MRNELFGPGKQGVPTWQFGSLNRDHDAMIFLRQRSPQPRTIAVLKPMGFSAAHISDTILVRNPVLKDTTRPWSVILPSSTGFGDCAVW